MNRLNGILGVFVSCVAVLLVVLVGWFAFVAPQRSKANDVKSQVDAAQSQLASDQSLLAASKRNGTLKLAHEARQAIPETPQVSNLLRELDGFAKQSRTEIDNVTPGVPVFVGGAQALPITLTFKGRYFGLEKLLQLLRQSADVKKGALVSTGRLFTVDSIQFTGSQTPGTATAVPQGTTAKPNGEISATIALNAFVYGGTPPAATTSTPTETASAAGTTP
jgi:Tfp pilus assembly protein PilO